MPGALGRRDAFGGGRSGSSGARGRPRGLERGRWGGPGQGVVQPLPRCQHPHPRDGRGGGGTCSAPAPPRGSFRAGVVGAACCSLGRVGTVSAVGPPGFPRSSGKRNPKS